MLDTINSCGSLESIPVCFIRKLVSPVVQSTSPVHQSSPPIVYSQKLWLTIIPLLNGCLSNVESSHLKVDCLIIVLIYNSPAKL